MVTGFKTVAEAVKGILGKDCTVYRRNNGNVGIISNRTVISLKDMIELKNAVNADDILVSHDIVLKRRFSCSILNPKIPF